MSAARSGSMGEAARQASERLRAALHATRLGLVEPVLAVVFPARCPGCGSSLARPVAGPLCATCWGAIPRHRGPLCPCGRPVPGGVRCGRCRRGREPFARGRSLGPYEGTLRIAIRELKYGGRQRVAARLTALLLREEGVRELLAGSLLVPVPLHRARRRARGFNQAELLARQLACGSGARLERRVLIRQRDTPSQTGLSAAQRRRNVAGAFRVERAERVAGRVVALVDDVFTTGATLRAAALALGRAGAAEVRVVTVARVP